MFETISSIISKLTGSIENFLKNYDENVEESEEYIAKNLKNGKIFYDFAAIQASTFNLSLRLLKQGYKSSLVQNQIQKTRKNLYTISQISFIKPLLTIISDMKFLYSRSSKYIIATMLLTIFPLAIILTHTLSTAPNLFFLYLIPLFPLLLFFEAIQFNMIDTHEKNQKISVLKSAIAVLGNAQSLILIFLFVIFLSSALILSIILLIALLFQLLTYLSSFPILLYIYIFILIFITLTVLTILFYLSILFFQAFFVAVLDGYDPIKSLLKSKKLSQKNISSIYLYSIIYSSFAALLIIFAVFYFSDIALYFIIALVLHLLFLFAYSLRRKMLVVEEDSQNSAMSKKRLFLPFTLVLLIGVVFYIALTGMVVSYYPTFLDAINAWQNTWREDRESRSYIDKNSGYSVTYPDTWQIYIWDDQSITLHHNVSETTSGTISINIKVIPFEVADYNRLNIIKPGTVLYNEGTREKITKNSNLLLAGKEAVKYTRTKPIPGATQYEIIYLISRENKIYELSLVTTNSILQQNYINVFEKIVYSLRFNNQ